METLSELLKTINENTSPKKYGEKGHIEHGWSKDIRERILQFSFQLVRTSDTNIEKLQNIYYQLLYELLIKYKFPTSALEKDMSTNLLKNLYKMIGHTRDTEEGKGEYALSYMMIYTWYYISPELACYALKTFIKCEYINQKQYKKPYGSWKDIKYFCNFCKSRGLTNDHLLIQYSINLINEQIKVDLSYLEANQFNKLSLVAKWIPRERSEKFGWLFDLLAIHYFFNYIETAKTNESLQKAILKCNMDYRKIVSKLNKIIDTVEIKQCNQMWSEIDFSRITSTTLLRQKNAFLNVKKDIETKSLLQDRIVCAENFVQYIEENKDKEIKGFNIGLNEFTKQALKLLNLQDLKNSTTIQAQIDLLNAQWRNNSSKNTTLGKMIALVDVSDSIEEEPKNAAIALGIRIAEKSILGKRLITFSSYPKWNNLESCETFTSMIKQVKQNDLPINQNFYAALDLILDAIIEVKMSPEDAQDLMLVIFSDMQVDYPNNENGNKNNLYTNIKKKYELTGINMYGKPLKPPHVLFWNLRCTNGFPSVSNQTNCSMISGFNPSLLNLFCEKGINGLIASTPWSIFIKSLENKRYQVLENKFLEVFL